MYSYGNGRKSEISGGKNENLKAMFKKKQVSTIPNKISTNSDNENSENEMTKEFDAKAIEAAAKKKNEKPEDKSFGITEVEFVNIAF